MLLGLARPSSGGRRYPVLMAALEWARVALASCNWLSCVGAAVNGTFRLVRSLNAPPNAVMMNERLLVEWALARRLQVTVLGEHAHEEKRWLIARGSPMAPTW